MASYKVKLTSIFDINWSTTVNYFPDTKNIRLYICPLLSRCLESWPKCDAVKVSKILPELTACEVQLLSESICCARKRFSLSKQTQNVYSSTNFETQLRECVRNASQADSLTFTLPPPHFFPSIVSLGTTHCDEFTKLNMISCFESPCGRHSSERSLLYWKRIREKAEMEQRDLKRFYRTSKRELNNSKEKNCKTGAILCTGTLLQNRWQKRKMKRRGR